jgi:hypothetical protein
MQLQKGYLEGEKRDMEGEKRDRSINLRLTALAVFAPHSLSSLVSDLSLFSTPILPK